eukprot:16151398-Heterocapsa_arctica.AAC.1
MWTRVHRLRVSGAGCRPGLGSNAADFEHIRLSHGITAAQLFAPHCTACSTLPLPAEVSNRDSGGARYM